MGLRLVAAGARHWLAGAASVTGLAFRHLGVLLRTGDNQAARIGQRRQIFPEAGQAQVVQEFHWGVQAGSAWHLLWPILTSVQPAFGQRLRLSTTTR